MIFVVVVEKACFQEYIIPSCGCYDYQYPVANATRQSGYLGCYTTSQVDCVRVNETYFYNSDAVNSCYAQCPIECESVHYFLSTSFAYYPSSWYTNRLRNASSIVNLFVEENEVSLSSTFQNALLMVNVYYDEMFYTLIEESSEITIELLIA